MVYDYMNLTTEWQRAVLGGAMGTLIAIGILFMILVFAALYVYHSLAWTAIAKKMKFKKSWLAWVPIASGAMKLKLGKFNWAWIFLILIPIFGWMALIVLITIATWRIFEKLRHPRWYALSFPLMFCPGISFIGFIAYFVIIGVVAWGKK
jgi:hypothetical protein